MVLATNFWSHIDFLHGFLTEVDFSTKLIKKTLQFLEAGQDQCLPCPSKSDLVLATILFNMKVLYYRKIVLGPLNSNLQIQILSGKPIYVIKFTKSSLISGAKFSNFLGREAHFGGNKEARSFSLLRY